MGGGGTAGGGINVKFFMCEEICSPRSFIANSIWNLANSTKTEYKGMWNWISFTEPDCGWLRVADIGRGCKTLIEIDKSWNKLTEVYMIGRSRYDHI